MSSQPSGSRVRDGSEKSNTQTKIDLPLQGIKVVDFSWLLPGPWTTQTLGSLGADVVKIEVPLTGDYSRSTPPHYQENGVYFSSVNRNKRSIVLDLTKQEDKLVATALLAEADVTVMAFRPGVPEKLGIGYETIRVVNPRMILCSVTGFGESGPMASLPGHDLSIQGMSGILNVMDSDALPAMPGFQAADNAAASYATIAILAAIIRRTRTGTGCKIEIPMFDSLVSFSIAPLSAAMAKAAGYSGTPKIEAWGGNPRYGIYRTRDGKAVTVALLESRTWVRFCEVAGYAELISEEGWADRHSSHGENAERYRKALTDFCSYHDRDELVALMTKAGVPICPIYSPDEALNSPEMRARQMIEFIDHPVDGRIPVIVDPLSKNHLALPARRYAPRMNEHCTEIREDLQGNR